MGLRHCVMPVLVRCPLGEGLIRGRGKAETRSIVLDRHTALADPQGILFLCAIVGLVGHSDIAGGRYRRFRIDMLSQTYEAEQKQLEAEAITLQQEIEVQERQNENIEKFIQKAHKYVGIEELDGYALRELVSTIYVDAPDKSSGKRVQPIHIKYDGLGFIPLNELMKKETA